MPQIKQSGNYIPSYTSQKGQGRQAPGKLCRSERIHHNSRPKHDYTDFLCREISKIRQAQKNSFGDRNIAAVFISHRKSWQSVFLAVSGKDSPVGLPPPEARAFKTSKVIFERSLDSEVKILEHIHKKIKEPKPFPVSTIYLHSEHPICESCRTVIRQFKKAHPKITVYSSNS